MPQPVNGQGVNEVDYTRLNTDSLIFTTWIGCKAGAVPKTSASGKRRSKLSAAENLRAGQKETTGWTKRKCQPSRANRQARVSAGARYSGREMPSFFIFQYNIERFIPSRAAAPLGPPTTQRVSRRATRICSRSASAKVSLDVEDWPSSEVSEPSSASDCRPLTSAPCFLPPAP